MSPMLICLAIRTGLSPTPVPSNPTAGSVVVNGLPLMVTLMVPAVKVACKLTTTLFKLTVTAAPPTKATKVLVAPTTLTPFRGLGIVPPSSNT